MNYVELLISISILIVLVLYINLVLSESFANSILKLDFYEKIIESKYIASSLLEKKSNISAGFCNITDLSTAASIVNTLSSTYKRGLAIEIETPTGKYLSNVSGNNAIAISRLCICNNTLCEITLRIW